VGLGEMDSSSIAPCFSIFIMAFAVTACTRGCAWFTGAFALAVVLTWHIETRLSQPKSEIRIRIRKHSDLFPVRPAVWISSASPCLCTRLAGPAWSPPPSLGAPTAFRPASCTWAPSAASCARRSFVCAERPRRRVLGPTAPASFPLSALVPVLAPRRPSLLVHRAVRRCLLAPGARALLPTQGGSVDQWISGGRCSHGGAEARRKQREEPTTRHKGNWRGVLSCFCLCVKHPWLPTGVLHFYTAPVIHPVRVHKCPWQAS
jgi:hypothetical protein